ncbi:hypothetical protein D3C80_725070 [compost metagenome]
MQRGVLVVLARLASLARLRAGDVHDLCTSLKGCVLLVFHRGADGLDAGPLELEVAARSAWAKVPGCRWAGDAELNALVQAGHPRLRVAGLVQRCEVVGAELVRLQRGAGHGQQRDLIHIRRVVGGAAVDDRDVVQAANQVVAAIDSAQGAVVFDQLAGLITHPCTANRAVHVELSVDRLTFVAVAILLLAPELAEH